MTISMTRGDTFPFKFKRKDADGAVITDTPVIMSFTVKTSWDTEESIFAKSLNDMHMDEDGVWHCAIEPEDTEDISYGTYVWDIEVVTQTYVLTIAKGELKVTEDSTWPVNRA